MEGQHSPLADPLLLLDMEGEWGLSSRPLGHTLLSTVLVWVETGWCPQKGEQARMLGKGLALAGIVQVPVLDPILPGRASGISLPEVAVRFTGEPQPVVTSCPWGVPAACRCPGHRFSMSHPCPRRGAEQSLLLPPAVGTGAVGRGIWGSQDQQLLALPSAPHGLGKVPILGAL